MRSVGGLTFAVSRFWVMLDPKCSIEQQNQEQEYTICKRFYQTISDSARTRCFWFSLLIILTVSGTVKARRGKESCKEASRKLSTFSHLLGDAFLKGLKRFSRSSGATRHLNRSVSFHRVEFRPYLDWLPLSHRLCNRA